jgi:hypothetical protein
MRCCRATPNSWTRNRSRRAGGAGANRPLRLQIKDKIVGWYLKKAAKVCSSKSPKMSNFFFFFDLPEWLSEEAIGVEAWSEGLGLSAVPTTSSSESSVFETVLLSADILAGSGCVVLSSVCLCASIACLKQ